MENQLRIVEVKYPDLSVVTILTNQKLQEAQNFSVPFLNPLLSFTSQCHDFLMINKNIFNN